MQILHPFASAFFAEWLVGGGVAEWAGVQGVSLLTFWLCLRFGGWRYYSLMATNDAAYLLRYLEVEPVVADEVYDLASASDAINNITVQVNALSAMGLSRFDRYKDSLRGLWKMVFESMAAPNTSNWSSVTNGFDSLRKSKRKVAAEFVYMLNDVRDNWLDFDATLTPESKENLTGLLDDATTALNADASLPVGLRVFVAQTLSTLSGELAVHEAGAPFDMHSAITRLFSALHMAEAATGNTTLWEKVKEKSKEIILGSLEYAVPNLIAGAGLVLQIAQQ